ncbi:ABC transporter permease [Gulosibacter sp. 10]|uniref:ABC transporter permease n=1 Tax=Gulosibacter sp. 10 TaxID=1255570 RepID=UPI00097E8C83|nr:ABC transporter permease [Gulosibacter sp. 10]SJM66408.1 Dipeptide transport system permease protein DppC (TC 3.A.1.5.2) [Gulosibacter sp. 10]
MTTTETRPAVSDAGPSAAAAPLLDAPLAAGTPQRPPGRPRARFAAFARRLRTDPLLVLAIAVFAVVLLWSFWPSLFTAHHPTKIDSDSMLLPPSAEHLFGTDQVGRDQFSRVVHGTALSMAATLVAVLVGLTIGSLVGLLAGYLRGWFDLVTMRIVDVIISLPSLLLSLIIVTAIGFGTVNVAIAVGLASSASFARIMRAEVIKVASSTYVQASRLYGGRPRHALFRHILPNSIAPVLSLAALEFGTAILAVAALSFLGFGATPPTPEWGALISEGRNYLATAWWLTVIPGLILAVVVVAANHISRAFQKGTN